MRAAPLALAALALALLAGCSEGDGPLAKIDCPFPVPDTHEAACARFTLGDGEGSVAFDTAHLIPKGGADGHIVYLPGGPGEAPVSGDGPPPGLLAEAGARGIVLFNPRGTTGTAPRMDCDFGEAIWSEDFTEDDARDSLVACRETVTAAGIDPARFSSTAIARDVDALVDALGVERAGIWGISYGTEAGLHLLADAPGWLDFAILDSVSLPGRAGLREFRAARDRFLETLDRFCFAMERCDSSVREQAADLTDWTARFDETPLILTPREDVTWSLDAIDVLDWLASLGGYPDGIDVAMFVIEGIALDRPDTREFMDAVARDNVEFAITSLPLLMEAYSDTVEPDGPAILREPTRYPSDAEGAAIGLAFQRLWHGDRPLEAPFVPEDAAPTAAPVPVLVLAGGVDPLTPAEWAFLLEDRFTGLERHLFPLLGHALSAGYPPNTMDPSIAGQLRCAEEVVRAFLDPTSTLSETCAALAAEENG